MRDVIQLTKEIVAFDTTSSNSNFELACFFRELLERMGFCVSLFEKDEDGVRKANLVARIGPKNFEPLMLSGHMDVMPPGEMAKWKTEPFMLTEIGDKYYGRGSVDMKGPLAAMICAVESLLPQASRFKRELMFGLTYDEEVGLKGAKRMVDSKVVNPKFILIAEPTQLIPMRMHKGHLCLTAFCWGKPGHAAFPRKGRNAIVLAERVIAELRKFGDELKAIKEPCIDPSYTTINIAAIRGNANAKVNEIPECCEIDFAVRPIPGQTSQRIRDYITHRLEQIGYDETNLPLVNVDLYMSEDARNKDERLMHEAMKRREDLTRRLWILEGRKGRKKLPTEPMCTSANSELVRVAEVVTGKSARGACYSTDASEFQRFGSDCLIFGPGSIFDAHQPNEFIETHQLLASIEQFSAIVTRMCL